MARVIRRNIEYILTNTIILRAALSHRHDDRCVVSLPRDGAYAIFSRLLKPWLAVCSSDSDGKTTAAVGGSLIKSLKEGELAEGL